MRSSVTPARDLNDGATGDERHRLFERRIIEVVEQDDVGPRIDGLTKLLHAIDLALDARGVRRMRACALDGDANATGRGDVVVLDEHGRGQVIAMVVTATAAHGVALRSHADLAWSCAYRRCASCCPRGNASTKLLVLVATPLMRCTKLSATRSPLRIEAALPSTRATTAPFCTWSPSAARVVMTSVGSTLAKARMNTARPLTTRGSRATSAVAPLKVGRHGRVGGHITASKVFEEGTLHKVAEDNTGREVKMGGEALKGPRRGAQPLIRVHRLRHALRCNSGGVMGI